MEIVIIKRERIETIILNGRRVMVSRPVKTISEEEFERIAMPIFKKIAKRLEKRKAGWITLPIIASISLFFVLTWVSNLSFGKIIINRWNS